MCLQYSILIWGLLSFGLQWDIFNTNECVYNTQWTTLRWKVSSSPHPGNLDQCDSNFYDIKKFQPIIFATFEVKSNPSLDCKLSDICIGTSAAPTYLPAYPFKNEGIHGNENDNDTEFNLIDGGVCANNPTLVAMCEVTSNNKDFPVKPMDYGKFLVISLGTGASQKGEKYDAKMAAKWGVFGWILHCFSSPLVDVFSQASVDMVDLYLAAVFKALKCEENYLRIQVWVYRKTTSPLHRFIHLDDGNLLRYTLLYMYNSSSYISFSATQRLLSVVTFLI